jgi:hypothetical protein
MKTKKAMDNKVILSMAASTGGMSRAKMLNLPQPLKRANFRCQRIVRLEVSKTRTAMLRMILTRTVFP